jgi:hypothetical protein
LQIQEIVTGYKGHEKSRKTNLEILPLFDGKVTCENRDAKSWRAGCHWATFYKGEWSGTKRQEAEPLVEEGAYYCQRETEE